MKGFLFLIATSLILTQNGYSQNIKRPSISSSFLHSINGTSSIYQSTGDLNHDTKLNVNYITEGLFQPNNILNDIPEVKSKFITLYPNPAINQISLKLDQNLNNCEVRITDLSGKIIQSNRFQVLSAVSVDVKKLSGGLYFLTIMDSENNRMYFSKFTKI